MAEQAVSADVLGLTAQIVSAHVSNNSIGAEALPNLIQEVYRTLAGMGKEQVVPDKQQPAVPGQEVGLSRTTSSASKTARS